MNEPTRHCLAWVVRNLATADYVLGVISDPGDCADTQKAERLGIYEIGRQCAQLHSSLEKLMLNACRREPGRTRAQSLELYRLLASLPALPAVPFPAPQACSQRQVKRPPEPVPAVPEPTLPMEPEPVEHPAPEPVTEPTPSGRKRRVRLTPEQLQIVLQRLAAGERQAVIAADYGVSLSCISSIKSRHKVEAHPLDLPKPEPRETNAQRKRRQRLTPQQLQTVLEMLVHGAKQMDIARIVGCSRSVVAMIKVRHRPSDRRLDALVQSVLAE